MTLTEKNINKYPWESFFGGALAYGEDIDLEQAELEDVMLFDFEPSSKPYAMYASIDKLKLALQLLYHSTDVMTDLQQLSHHDSWKYQEQRRAMDRLEAVAIAHDERAFLEVLQQVNWHNHPPANFVRAAQLALKAGAYREAYWISAKGAEYYPDNSELQKYARVLAPPKAVSGKATTNSGHKANREWLKDHGSEYSGQWVAVRNGQLLGTSDSLKELAERVGSTKDVLLTKVL